MIAKYDLQGSLPEAVLNHLQDGIAGLSAETVKVTDPCLIGTHNVIIGNLGLALEAASVKAKQLGYATRIVTDNLQGEARAAAGLLAAQALNELAEMRPGERRCLLSGGETTVTVRGTGLGGRNQELALAFALEIAGVAGVSLLSAGTDGTDGPTDAAGAMVDGATAALARSLGIEPRRYLADNDSYGFFRLLEVASGARCHFKTGPTGTNVMDVQIVLLNKPA